MVGDRALVRSDRAVAEQLGDELVILDPDRDRYFRLNATGAHLWAQLERPRTVAELGASLAERFGLGAERAARDAEGFAGRMLELELVAGA